MSILQKKHSQNYLTIFTAFMVWWWSLGCLRFAYNGVFQKVLFGRLGIFLFFSYIILYIIGRSRMPEMFGRADKKTAIGFMVINVLIFMVSFIIGGQLITGDFFIMAFLGWAILTFNVETRMKVFDAYLFLTITLLVLSLLEFVFFAITGLNIVLGIVERSFATGGSQVFVQTLFNFILMNDDVPRFQSLFEEPGGVGNVAILLLFITGDNVRYRFAHIVAWISGIVSFSLGFYVLAIIYLISKKIKIQYIFIAAVFLLLFIRMPFLMERFDKLIVYRIQDRSIEEIDDRSNDVLDAALDRSMRDGTIWLGHGGVLPKSFQEESGVSGAKPFIYKYGLLLTLLALAFYIFTSRRQAIQFNLSRRKYLSLVAFFLFSFYKSALLFQPFFVLMFFLYPFAQNLGESKTEGRVRSHLK